MGSGGDAGRPKRGRLRLRAGWRGALLALVTLVLGAQAARAQTVTVTPTPLPLPGSQFQGGDGDQDNAPALIDWQGLQADGRVEHTSDPQASDNVFSGGSEELNPDEWGITTQNGGATPGSSNVLDIYRSVDGPPGGDVFLYLAFTRYAGNGTIFVTFELNQQARLWRNSHGALIPCRTTGDILISFEEHGNAADVQLDRWVSDQSDPATGCATTGHLDAVVACLRAGRGVQPTRRAAPAPDRSLAHGTRGAADPRHRGSGGRAGPDWDDHLPAVRSGQCRMLGRPHLHLGGEGQWERDLQLRALHPTAGRNVSMGRSLLRRRQQPPGGAERLRDRHGDNRAQPRPAHHLHDRVAVTLGGAIHDTAHLSGGVAPTGTMTFRLYGLGDMGCMANPIFTSTVRVAGNGDYVSQSFVPAVAGVYRWVADYSGDAANRPAGPTTCGDSAELAIVRPPTIIPVVPAFSTTASERPVASGSLYDVAHLTGGVSPGGAITFTLYGPDDLTCSGPPAFTAVVTVTGNGSYFSPVFAVPRAGTYRWVATYSGDAMNAAVGPTGCGDPSETSVVSSAPNPNDDPGPNVPAPPKPKPKPKPTPRPKPPPPVVTG
jgi:hypothetical protein